MTFRSILNPYSKSLGFWSGGPKTIFKNPRFLAQSPMEKFPFFGLETRRNIVVKSPHF